MARRTARRTVSTVTAAPAADRTALYALGALALLGGGYYLWRQRQTAQNARLDAAPDGATTPGTTPGTTTTTTTTTPPAGGAGGGDAAPDGGSPTPRELRCLVSPGFCWVYDSVPRPDQVATAPRFTTPTVRTDSFETSPPGWIAVRYTIPASGRVPAVERKGYVKRTVFG